LINEKERLLGGCILTGSFEGTSVWVKVKLHIESAGEGLIEDLVRDLLCN
jgi:hypothetical protein